jgi:hypothetical protein
MPVDEIPDLALPAKKRRIISTSTSMMRLWTLRPWGLSTRARSPTARRPWTWGKNALGIIGTKVFGRRLITRFESRLKHLPLAGTLYSVSKQVVGAFSTGDRSVCRSVVLVD